MRLLALAVVFSSSVVLAQNALVPGVVEVDRPTLAAVGVRWLVSGDANRNATGTVRYRVMGTANWRSGPPLHRVHPQNVTAITVPEQLSASVFDLRAGTTYELELTSADPDGGGAVTTVTSTTRSVPADPATPRVRTATNTATLNTALSGAQAGDVITLADGVYQGNFAINASGTASNPIVLRGTSREGTVLDGNGCTACNVLEGRLSWPAVYADDSGAHANDDGINVQGSGHVVCHNDLIGFGDAMKTEQVNARSTDFYGNEIRSCYDNAMELDTSSGNTRALRNRITNRYAPISFQPIYGGPVYAVRNVVVNEQMK